MYRNPLFWLIACLVLTVTFTTRNLMMGQEQLFHYSSDLPEIFHLVDQAYVDDVNMAELFPNIFQGAAEAVDENASYIPPGEPLVDLTEKVYRSTGLMVIKRYAYPYVLAVEAESPAAAAGIRKGLYLRAINGNDTRNLSIFQVRRLLAEEVDSFRLKVIDRDKADDYELSFRPGSFAPAKAKHIAYQDGIEVIQIPAFYEELDQDLVKLLEPLKKKAGTLVLDLRDNAFGGDRELRLLASLFLNKGKIAAWANGGQPPEEILNPRKGAFQNLNLYILQDTGTSKAAETFTAIAQDLGAARVVGLTSLGTPDEFQLIKLKNGGSLSLPKHNLLLNSGRTMTAGVTPDLAIEPGDPEPGVDTLLDQALDQVRANAIERKKAS